MDSAMSAITPTVTMSVPVPPPALGTLPDLITGYSPSDLRCGSSTVPPDGTNKEDSAKKDGARKDSAERDSANSMLVTRWLERLLQHFGMHELEAVSEHSLAVLLARCGEDRLSLFKDRRLLSELKRRVVRLAGAQLDDVFIAMVPDIVTEDEIELISLPVESRRLEGMRYQNEVYRLVESFEPCHRLQALCLGQTLADKVLDKTISDEAISTAATSVYLITRSTERFAVWVNIRLLPEYCYPQHLPSTGNILDLAG